MKMHVKMDVAGRSIDEVVDGTDADDILGQIKARVTRELGWKGLFLNALTPLAFAQMAVQRYNTSHKASLPVPATADDFLALGQQMGYVTFLSRPDPAC